MDTRRIGDLEVTIVGIGCNNFGRRLDSAGAGAVVHAAMEAGINLFDTADVYGDGASEEYLGSSDTAIIKARRMLLQAVRGLEQGREPPGLEAEQQRVRSVSIMLPKDVPFQDGARDAFTAVRTFIR